MKKLNRISQMLLISAFSLFLIAAIFLTWRARDKTYSFYENRALAQRPAYSAEAVLDGRWFSDLENYLIDRAAGHNTLSLLNVRLDMALRRPVVNDVVVRDGMLLAMLPYESADPAQLQAAAERMAERVQGVDALVSSYGGQFCHVIVPSHYAYNAERYPAYLNHREEDTALKRTLYSAALDRRGVAYVDLWDAFEALGRPASLSSTVDHHYSVYGAYEIYRAAMERFRADGAELSVSPPEAFEEKQAEQPYLGSRMRKLLGAWESDERLWYLTPKDPVPFTRFDNGKETEPTVFSFPAEGAEWVTYDFFMGGDIAHTVIDTHRDDLPNILIYGDSYTNAIETIAYVDFNEMHSLDFRHYSELTLREYIAQYQPDYVICVRDYASLLDPYGNGIGAD